MITLSSALCGVSGEYFVAAELSRLGYIASITLRNTKGIDILVSNIEANRQVGIQVKTSKGSKPIWILNEKAEKFIAENRFYVFVNLKGRGEHPDYYIVPSKVVAIYITTGHNKWLTSKSRKGLPHKDNPIRQFADQERKYLDRWDLLAL